MQTLFKVIMVKYWNANCVPSLPIERIALSETKLYFTNDKYYYMM